MTTEHEKLMKNARKRDRQREKEEAEREREAIMIHLQDTVLLVASLLIRLPASARKTVVDKALEIASSLDGKVIEE